MRTTGNLQRGLVYMLYYLTNFFFCFFFLSRFFIYFKLTIIIVAKPSVRAPN